MPFTLLVRLKSGVHILPQDNQRLWPVPCPVLEIRLLLFLLDSTMNVKEKGENDDAGGRSHLCTSSYSFSKLCGLLSGSRHEVCIDHLFWYDQCSHTHCLWVVHYCSSLLLASMFTWWPKPLPPQSLTGGLAAASVTTSFGARLRSSLSYLSLPMRCCSLIRSSNHWPIQRLPPCGWR
jgi:hypothetical protein